MNLDEIINAYLEQNGVADKVVADEPIRTQEQLDRALRERTYIKDPVTGAYEYDHDKAEELEAEYQDHVAKIQSVSAVYSKADTIIVGDFIPVSVDSEGAVPSPAYNDGRSILFNASLLENIDDSTITSLHGFNYHEVAHILYSPRRGSELGKWIRDNSMRRPYNILEDSRIERLLIAKYPSTRLYLEACITDYLLKGDPKEWKNYFHLITGRKYIDLEVRQAICDRFINAYSEDMARDIADIVHTYRTLVFPDDYDKAIELITRFSKYTGTDDEPEGMIPTNKHDHDTRDVGDKGRPKGKNEQTNLQKRANQMEQGSGDEDMDNRGSETNEAELEDKTTETTEADRQLRDKINERHDKIINNPQVKGGTNEIRTAIEANSSQGSTVKMCNYQDKSVSNEYLDIADRFAHTLERLRIENDPMWQLEQPQGRLNVARTIHADINDIDRLFDRWHIGNDNRDIEAVILLDNSGSMSYRMAQALQATWTIKKAIETIDGRVTVYRFNHDGRLLYSANDKANSNTFRYIGSTGSTNPYSVLLESERILQASDRGIKLLFTVSDGGWDNSVRNDEIMARIGNIEGAITVSVLLADFSWQEREYGAQYVENMTQNYRHNSHIFHAVADERDLIEVANKVVTSALVAPAH